MTPNSTDKRGRATGQPGRHPAGGDEGTFISPRRPVLHAVILAGGRGTRFWPRSRRRRAKQVLNVAGEQTLIQQTLDRIRPLCPPEFTWIITNELLRDEIVKQLPAVPPSQVIAEPAQRNTAPAIGLAAHLLARQAGRDAVMGVFPSDHVITRAAAFRKVLRVAAKGARQGALVVLGIRPRWPETGYGYVQFERRLPEGEPRLETVARFREKPDLATARRYLRTGRHFWNSGMFVWTVGTVLDALQQHLPKTAGILQQIAADFRPETLARLYPECENISIDYAVMEKAATRPGLNRPGRTPGRAGGPGTAVAGVACEIGWNDVGSWNAVYELLPHDAAGNAVRGPVWLLDVRDSYLDVADVAGKMIAAIGIEGLVVVDTPDALVIVPRARAHEVSKVVSWLEKQKRDELL